MASIGFYSRPGDLIDTSAIKSNRADYHLDKIEAEAQKVADECQIEVVAWARDDSGERERTIGIKAHPRPRS